MNGLIGKLGDLAKKEQFYGLYLGQHVAVAGRYDGNPTDIKGMRRITLQMLTDEIQGCLILKNLENISVEDAKEIYCVARGFLRKDDVNIEEYSFKNLVLLVKASSLKYSHFMKKENIHFLNLKISSTDYLRSKGYLLPFQDLSIQDILDRGWASYSEDKQISNSSIDRIGFYEGVGC